MNDEVTSWLVFMILSILIIIVCIIFGPFIQIWAVNTLFKTEIEYSWLNWLATLLLTFSIKNFSISKRQ